MQQLDIGEQHQHEQQYEQQYPNLLLQEPQQQDDEDPLFKIEDPL